MFALRSVAAYAAIAAICSGVALAEYPDKPIEIVVAYKAGGGSDSLARQIQSAIEKHKLSPVPIVVTNVDGAGGIVASREVARATPDGYKILQIHNDIVAKAASGTFELGLDVLEPVIHLTEACLYLAAPASAPYNNFDEFVAYAKANPGKLKVSETIGGISHFPLAQITQQTGATFGLVQAGGTAERFSQMKGGLTQAAMMSPGWIKRGGAELKSLIAFGDQRFSDAPDMPTAKEKNLDVIGCLNRRFWAPKGTPADRVQWLGALFTKALNTPEVQQFVKSSGEEVRAVTGQAARDGVKAELAAFQKVAPLVKEAMGKK